MSPVYSLADNYLEVTMRKLSRAFSVLILRFSLGGFRVPGLQLVRVCGG